MNPSPEETTQLLQKAAKCYLKAGWLTEACRVWEQIGDCYSTNIAVIGN
ncbi:hypothetical protein [Scytonema hofmannii]|nr:hypothetical protein [Scytonema hofmannii]